MNLSREWTVLHEPRASLEEVSFKRGEELPKQTQKAFSQTNYGEVNSYCRFYFEQIEVAKKGIVLRDPKEVITSIANRKDIHQTGKLVEEVNYFWNYFHKLLQEDSSIRRIDFGKMTTDVGYVQELLSYFNITDISEEQLKEKLGTKVNTNASYTYNIYEELPQSIQKAYTQLEWYQI